MVAIRCGGVVFVRCGGGVDVRLATSDVTDLGKNDRLTAFGHATQVTPKHRRDKSFCSASIQCRDYLKDTSSSSQSLHRSTLWSSRSLTPAYH